MSQVIFISLQPTTTNIISNETNFVEGYMLHSVAIANTHRNGVFSGRLRVECQSNLAHITQHSTHSAHTCASLYLCTIIHGIQLCIRHLCLCMCVMAVPDFTLSSTSRVLSAAHLEFVVGKRLVYVVVCQHRKYPITVR